MCKVYRWTGQQWAFEGHCIIEEIELYANLGYLVEHC